MRRVHRQTRDADSSQASFNDLLFNSLGVFLLLLLTMMAMIGVPDVSMERLAQAEVAWKRLEAELAATRQTASRAATEHDQARKRLEAELDSARANTARLAAERDRVHAAARAMEPRPIAVALTIDGTNSMAPTLNEQQSATLTVAEIGSRLSPRFQLGVVVYRDAARTAVFPLTEIGPSVNGQPSPGMTALRSFLTAHMEPIGAAADVEDGLGRAIGMLQRVPAGTRRAVCMLGDTGPWEGGAIDAIEPQDRRSEERCVQTARAFAAQPDTRVLTVFTGRNVTGLRHVPETVTFFKRLAGSGGQYSEDTSHMTATVLEALLKPSN